MIARCVDCSDGDMTCNAPDSVTDSFSEHVVSSSGESVNVVVQNMESDGVSETIETHADVELHTETNEAADRPADQLTMDHCEKNVDLPADIEESPLADSIVDDAVETSQSKSSIQEHWRLSNPFLGVTESNADSGDSVTPELESSSSFVQTLTPADISDGVTDSSPLSASAPSDMVTSYSKLRESGTSSVCSTSPYESPTHTIAGAAAAAADLSTDAVGSRPDSLYLSRSILQERERQWLAKKGSYSSLSECDSSPAGSMEALIEAATSTPLHSQGTVSVEGDMITFVADGINELIKRSRGGKYPCFMC